MQSDQDATVSSSGEPDPDATESSSSEPDQDATESSSSEPNQEATEASQSSEPDQEVIESSQSSEPDQEATESSQSSEPDQEATESSQSSEPDQEELEDPRADFTARDWDNFFSIRGVKIPFEKHAEWPQLDGLLTDYLLARAEPPKHPQQRPKPDKMPAELRILVPGCGNSRLSEDLYDAGFRKITNVDSSKVAIRNMLKRNGIERPKMKWRLGDMKKMPFADDSFDAVVDKGGYDTLMAGEHDASYGNAYLNEVKRLLRDGGKFICVTILEPHALDLLFRKLRRGWKMSLHTIALEPESEQKQQLFMVVFVKDYCGTAISEISTFLDDDFAKYHGDQASQLNEALNDEKVNRANKSTTISHRVSYSLNELKRGIKGDLSAYEPGRRLLLQFGGPKLVYKCVLLDAKQDSGCFIHHYCVQLIPETTGNEWLYTTDEGQWFIVESTRAARLLMVFPVTSRYYSPEYIQGDLAKYVRQLEPGYTNDGNIFDMLFKTLKRGDTKLERKAVHQAVSGLHGPFGVEDFTIHARNENGLRNDRKFRCLMFRRAGDLVQVGALFSAKASVFDSHLFSNNEMKIDHNYLTTPYHKGIFPGLMLIFKYRKISYTMKALSKGVIIGLGVGLLPMFMKGLCPSLKIEAFELDPLVRDIARDYFDLQEDERLQVHIGDGIEFVEGLGISEAEEKLDFLIVDVPSSSTSSGLKGPDDKYVQESFFWAAKRALSEQGIFVINLASKSTTAKDKVYTRLKMVFRNLFRLKLVEEMDEIIFAMKADDLINEARLSQARNELAITPRRLDQWNQRVLDLSKSVERLNLESH